MAALAKQVRAMSHLFKRSFLQRLQQFFNGGSDEYVAWTFRKQEKFFDIVTYTGTGSSHNISHNLNTTPGMVIVKRYDNY